MIVSTELSYLLTVSLSTIFFMTPSNFLLATVAQEFKDMLQVVLNKMAERVVLPEPERESRGRLLQQRLADAYKSTTRQPVDFDDT